MSNKEFAMFLQLIALLLKEGKTDEVLKIIEKHAGEIELEPDNKQKKQGGLMNDRHFGFYET